MSITPNHMPYKSQYAGQFKSDTVVNCEENPDE